MLFNLWSSFCWQKFHPETGPKIKIQRQKSQDPLAEVLDCTEMVNSVTSLEDIDLALEYLERRFNNFIKNRFDQRCTLVFDNIL